MEMVFGHQITPYEALTVLYQIWMAKFYLVLAQRRQHEPKQYTV